MFKSTKISELTIKQKSTLYQLTGLSALLQTTNYFLNFCIVKLQGRIVFTPFYTENMQLYTDRFFFSLVQSLIRDSMLN